MYIEFKRSRNKFDRPLEYFLIMYKFLAALSTVGLASVSAVTYNLNNKKEQLEGDYKSLQTKYKEKTMDGEFLTISLKKLEESKSAVDNELEKQKQELNTLLDKHTINHEATRYGVPTQIDIIERPGYVVGYNRSTRNPSWVCQHLQHKPSQILANVTREVSEFKEDPLIDSKYQAKLDDYKGSGFDRGHLTPAADHKETQELMNDTFFLSNISPQVGNGFNRHYWARFENFARGLLRDWNDVYVCTGTLFLPNVQEGDKHYVKYQVIGNPPNVAVPTHFYKVMLATNPRPKLNEKLGEQQEKVRHAVGSFIMPNEAISPDIPLESFACSKEHLERLAGLNFFDKINDVDVDVVRSSTSSSSRAENLLHQFTENIIKPKPMSKELMVVPEKTKSLSVVLNSVKELCTVSSCKLPPPWQDISDEEKQFLSEQVQSFSKSGDREIAFPTTLTSAARKVIHTTAEGLNLNHVTVVNNGISHVVVSRKDI
eukprot:TRINITY_DN1960_c0_g1_i1.p1 TRINITY_DN1960_c0_g1~~TRINITY_DN1960_c0_g1_i1.p1  ORF type:complete len:486 (-),score=130.91 TRINITY_DN1960_c0_g1_i1:17-1474(-)